jgi:transposase-like protein
VGTREEEHGGRHHDGRSHQASQAVEEAATELLREMVKLFCERVISEEVDAICGAPYGERSDERTNRRNGYRKDDLGHAPEQSWRRTRGFQLTKTTRTCL